MSDARMGKRLGIETRRKMSKSRVGELNPMYGLRGELSPHWRNGISCEPYCDAWADNEYKEDLKFRDGHKCQNPDCWGVSDRRCLHHIDYDKKNCQPLNLVTLCNSCNTRANVNRKYWQALYTWLMLKKYSCKYIGQ